MYKSKLKHSCLYAVLVLACLASFGCGRKDEAATVPETEVEEEAETKVFRNETYRDTLDKTDEDAWVEQSEEYYENLYLTYFDNLLEKQFPYGMVITKSYSNTGLKEMYAKDDDEFYYQTFYKDIKKNKWMQVTLYQASDGQVYLNDGLGRGWQYSSEMHNLLDPNDINMFQIDMAESKFIKQVERQGVKYDVLKATDGKVQYLVYVNHRTEKLFSIVYRDGDVDVEMQFQSMNNIPTVNGLSSARECEMRVLEYNAAYYLTDEVKKHDLFAPPSVQQYANSNSADGNAVVEKSTDDSSDDDNLVENKEE